MNKLTIAMKRKADGTTNLGDLAGVEIPDGVQQLDGREGADPGIIGSRSQ